MIRQVFSAEELNPVLDKIPPDIFTSKIKALMAGYGFSYSFLRFYIGDGGFAAAVYYGSALISGNVGAEAAEFIKSLGCREALIPEAAKDFFGEYKPERLNIMRYGGAFSDTAEPLSTDTSYEKVYEILSDGFDIGFDDWYTDTCHNVRHGISTVYTLENAAAAVKMFTIDGISLVSFVSVKKERRGEGLGGRLIRAASELLKKSGGVYVICEDRLISFYGENGYDKFGGACSVNMRP